MTEIMKNSFFSALLLSLFVAMPMKLEAQVKAWATYNNGVLTFSYGAKPKAPAQVNCSGCNRKIAFSSNFCSNCGTKNEKDFTVYDALAKVSIPWDKTAKYSPWFEKREFIKKVVFNVSFKQVTNITNTANWFNCLRNMTTIVGLENFNTSKSTNMEGMFEDCSSLKTIDLSHFNTSNVTDMNRMFFNCKSLTSLDLSHFKTDKVTNMALMFEFCENLTSLYLSNFNTINVTAMYSMFADCKNLTSLEVSHFNTSKVTDMSGMFENCQRLASINLSSFNTSQVTGFTCMFESCESLKTLDISNFDTRNATSTHAMFRGCCQLQTIYVSATNWVGLKYLPGISKPTLMSNEGSTYCQCNAKIIKK